MTAPLEERQRCFSTLGCVELDFQEICNLAAEFQIPGVELRGISGRMDMPQLCAEQGLTPARVHEICKENRTHLVVAGSSIKLTNASKTEFTDLLVFSAWAESLRIPWIRVFGGGTCGQPLTDADYTHALDLIHAWRQEKTALGWQVELLLETHDAFSASAPCLELNRRLVQPLNLIWDSHHTWRVGGEALEWTWNQLGALVKHVHVKDSIDRPSARHPYTYVLPGDGQMPLHELMNLLERHHFHGFISLEWEKFWHPYLPPLRDALARFGARPESAIRPLEKAALR